MFGSEREEELTLNQLEGTLNLVFDKKIGNFGSRAEGIKRELSNAKSQFTDASKKFDQLDVEPDRENFYINDSSVLREQKGSYSKAMSRIAGEWELEISNAPNVYYKYDTVLFGTERFREEVLKANSKFKKVMYSYSNYLEGFKKSFSRMEKSMESLKSEINRVEREFSEYKVLSDKIKELRTAALRKSEIERDTDSTVHLGEGVSADGTDETKAQISSVNSEISKLDAEISDSSGRIHRMCLSLDRPARKLDYTAHSKRLLHPYISDPTGTISDELRYGEFRALLGELEKSIDEGAPDKESAKIKENISRLIDSNIFESIKTINGLKSKRSELASQVRLLEIRLKTQEDSMASARKRSADRESLIKERDELNNRIDSLSRSVRELFALYYKKQIKVVL